jgi:D-alanyl-D-alanine carboxypeptidase
MSNVPHAQIMEWWDGYLCDTSTHESVTLNGRSPVKLQASVVPAAYALEAAIMGSGYRTPMGVTGSYNCRKIGGSDTWSLHAFAIAIDWDYSVNPYLRGETFPKGFLTDPRFELTEANVEAVEAIVNVYGEQIWWWAGRTIGDTMHFQIQVPPDRLELKEPTMDLERWATRLRNPLDYDQMVVKGVITEAERDYWVTVATDSPEMQDLRDAVEVRNPLWTQ